MKEFDVGCFVAESRSRIDSMTDSEVDLIVRELGPMSYAEIARVSGLSPQAIGNICKRAESKLRLGLREWGD